MSEALVGILIFLAVIAITTVVFWAWLVVMVLRAGLRMLRWTVSLFLPVPPPAQSPSVTLCPRSRCRATNPPGAHFCRRCGRELLPLAYSHPQAAVW